jgi:hypothetical protein
MIMPAGINARIRRLESLALALALECQLLRAARDPLLYAERRDYLSTIGRATVALDEARVALAGAMQRLDATSKGNTSGREDCRI